MCIRDRFYRLRPGCEAPPQEGPIGGDLGYLKYAVFVSDNATFSVTFGTDTHESVMRPRLLRPELFDTAARHLPATRAWVDRDRAEPISDVEVMARLVNRRRRLVVDDRPLTGGVVALGDALVHTNPLYGRGCSLGMVHAFGLADLMVEDDDPTALALGIEHLTQRELDPWYRTSVMQDLENQRAARGEVATDDPMRSLMRDGLMPAVRTDADVFRAFLRVLNLLDPPDAMIRGRPSSTSRRRRLTSRAITSTGLMGPARSTHSRVAGRFRAAASNSSGRNRRGRMTASLVSVPNVTENVSLSPTNTAYLR